MSGTRHRATPTAQPFVLDGLPGTPPRQPRSVAGWGRAFGACCFAGKLRSPAHASGDAATRPNFRAATPTSFPTSTPTSFPTRWGCVPLASLAERIGAGQSPSWGQSAAKTAADWPPYGGVERPRRVVRFARLIHRHGRDLGRACGPRRLRRQSQPAWLLLSVARYDRGRTQAGERPGCSIDRRESR